MHLLVPLQQRTDPVFLVFLCFAIVVGLLIHFIPSIIAILRHHTNTVWIVILNIFFGWTVIGWIVLLIFALVGKTDRSKSLLFS